MRVGLILALALAATLSGCGPTVWDKAGATQQDFNVDSYACERDARQSGYFGTGLVGASNMKQFYNECMVSKGYVPRT
jgi:hypothetical protein